MQAPADRARAQCRLWVIYFMAAVLLVVMVAVFSSKLWMWGLVFLGLFMVTCGAGICYENHGRTDPDAGAPNVFYSVFWGRSFRDEAEGPVWL
jgi:hypothetical protein